MKLTYSEEGGGRREEGGSMRLASANDISSNCSQIGVVPGEAERGRW